MAINSTKRRDISKDARFKSDPSGQPDSFLAKRKGFQKDRPNFPATARNANAFLHNRATPDSNDSHKIYLFVDYVSTGWTVAGEITQAHSSRSFYPRNLIQNDVEIRGTVANNYEYDRLVKFVEHHQNTVLRADSFKAEYFPAVEFGVFEPEADSRTFYQHRRLKYRIAILSIEAGAERFQFARTFSIRCKVLYDYLSLRSEVTQAIDRAITLKEVFGETVHNAKPYISSSAVEKEVAARVASNERMLRNKDRGADRRGRGHRR